MNKLNMFIEKCGINRRGLADISGHAYNTVRDWPEGMTDSDMQKLKSYAQAAAEIWSRTDFVKESDDTYEVSRPPLIDVQQGEMGELMKRTGMTSIGLARLTGHSENSVARWKHGKRVPEYIMERLQEQAREAKKIWGENNDA